MTSKVLALVAGCSAMLVAAPNRHISHAEARPILRELGDLLPVELQALPANGDEDWDGWIEAHDSAIRARVARGDEDGIVSWLLFGTSFTAQARAVVNPEAAADPQALGRLSAIVRARADDLVRALQEPGADERRLFARRFLEGNGFGVATPAAAAETRDHLLQAVQRVGVEQQTAAAALREARDSGDPETELAVRSTLFSDRGLGLDTSLPVNYAVDKALAALKKQGLLKPGTVRRVAIVGGGLDVTDRAGGFDFYPPQIVQPFAVIDALRAQLLSPPAGVPDIVVFDISPRVLDHVARMQAQAVAGTPYTIVLPRPTADTWQPEIREYWRTFGTHVGTSVAAAHASVDGLSDARTIRVPATTVRHVSGVDLNIVTDRLADERFDLVIATNVLVYYDALDHELAAGNIDAMLRPGGVLVSNTALPEMEAVPIELMGSIDARYTRGSNADQMLWYKRVAGAGSR